MTDNRKRIVLTYGDTHYSLDFSNPMTEYHDWDQRLEYMVTQFVYQGLSEFHGKTNDLNRQLAQNKMKLYDLAAARPDLHMELTDRGLL